MKYLLWRLAADSFERVEGVGAKIVVDEVARMHCGDRWHRWREYDFGRPVVHDKVAWLEWAHDMRTFEALPHLGYTRPITLHERFGAFCLSFRIPASRNARVSKAFETVVGASSWKDVGRLIDECPGGTFCAADTFVCSWRADGFWTEEAAGRTLARLCDFEWVCRPDGSIVAPPEAPRSALYSVSGGRDYRRMLDRIERHHGREAREECYMLFDRNAMVVMASFGLLSLGGARLDERMSSPAPVDFIEAQALGDPTPEGVPYLELSLTPEAALLPGVVAQVREAYARDRGCMDLESIAAWADVPYVLISAEAAKCGMSGVTRLTPEECDEIRRQREEEEAERLEALERERRAAEEAIAEEEERLRREELDRRRHERWEAWKARRDATRAERERQAALRSRMQSSSAPKRDADERTPRPRWRPERPKDRTDPLLGAVMLPPGDDEDNASRPGSGYRWDDDGDLVHQGLHWRVVYATTPSGRSPVRDYVEWLREVAPGDYDSIMDTIRIVADDPMGHMPVAKRFKCFSRPSGYLLCEFKRSGLSGHARVLAFRDTRSGADGKVERRIVLLHGFSKQTNATPEEDLLRADSYRAFWLSRR